ncbi:dehydrogenase [Actinomadura sp. LD22]|uniref:Dehydrogenase n=2 Tax=Actinomadura physcomitrii TaxID=2650748 RepID=A0A6I4M9L2_9ACTN|nr:dehydrogenase [Actinomadura physcomitrii]
MSDLSTYRENLRAWLRANAPAPTPTIDLNAAKAFQACLFDAGYAGITWPKDVGGQGLGPEYQQIFSEESSDYELPTSPFGLGMGMCGPTLNDLGTAQQRTRYLPKLLRGEEIWCQLFSEPGAGSDVASLQTRAVRTDDGWVVDGQKVWTTNAQFADYGTLLARTDPDRPKHSGLTMFVIDMRAPGVTVRPLRDMTGHAPFNEVILDSVRLPADAVIGEVNDGWKAAVVMLGHERVAIGSRGNSKTNPFDFDGVHAMARDLNLDGDPAIRAGLADLYTRERVLDLFNIRVGQETSAGTPPGARGSVGKLAGTMLARLAVEVVSEIAGPAAAGWEPDDTRADAVALGINSTPSSGIAGGTNEIQRGIIGERILGLPKEPSVDRGVPFRELKVGTQR